jgi:hypothetical protein
MGAAAAAAGNASGVTVIVDTFPLHDELDILEMRLTELFDVVDAFVPVEAEVTHQDRPKPSYLHDNWERFAPFRDKLFPVWATGLPSRIDDPDPWARELSQREHIATGLAGLGVTDTDIVMQSDVDEIPRAFHVRNLRPGDRMVAFGQRGHFWAVDWLYPEVWRGTVAGTVATIGRLGPTPFGNMRTARNHPALTWADAAGYGDAGWHFSWLGGPERAMKKVAAFCHPEVEEQLVGAIDNDHFYWREGWHVDGKKLAPVDVDGEWPQWIRDGNAPESWYRPRG